MLRWGTAVPICVVVYVVFLSRSMSPLRLGVYLMWLCCGDAVFSACRGKSGRVTCHIAREVVSSSSLLCPCFSSLYEGSGLLCGTTLFHIQGVFANCSGRRQARGRIRIFRRITLLRQSCPGVRIHEIVSCARLRGVVHIARGTSFFSKLPERATRRVIGRSIASFGG